MKPRPTIKLKRQAVKEGWTSKEWQIRKAVKAAGSPVNAMLLGRKGYYFDTTDNCWRNKTTGEIFKGKI